MTQQFHEGEEVEVCEPTVKHPDTARNLRWRKAKIVRYVPLIAMQPEEIKSGKTYLTVQFPDGNRAVFDAEHIRPLDPAEEYPGLAEPDDDTSDPMGSGMSP